MALATANEIKAGLILLSEPNRNAIRYRKDWITDLELDTAIKILNKNIAIIGQGHGHGYTYVTTSNCTIYSCYCSGNDEIQDLERTLEEIGTRIRRNNEKAIVAGDFNGKSPQWGMHKTDARGEIICDWIAQNDMAIVNRGNTPTFHRQDYSSILDLTIATSNLVPDIESWYVSDKVSLSDHSYLIFNIADKKTERREIQQSKGWQVRKLDLQKLQEAARTLEEGESVSESFSEKLTEICDKCMPKRKIVARGRPVYWWTDEIASYRKECLAKRRAYSRAETRNLPDLRYQLWEQYKQSKKILKDAIKKAKRASWKALCDTVDCDIWGDGYKLVVKRLAGFPPKPTLTLTKVEEIAHHLFPVHDSVIFDCENNTRFVEFTLDELQAACSKLKNNKAPGPGNIPSEVIKHIVSERPDYVLRAYNELAARAHFPEKWKKAKLVLLQKPNKPLENPASYRPICLLDIEGKLYEHLILARLKQELVRTGDLSQRQFGFRKGRQTVDAIKQVIEIARKAAAYSNAHRRLCAMITLDVRNAFNSASWQLILEELRRRGIEESLTSIIASYLSKREIIMETEDTCKTREVNSGVPQGSVLGPTLWNILYDELLETELPDGATLFGFADDVALVVVAKHEETLMNITNTAIQRVVNWMNSRKLELAPEKTEAVLLTTRRKIQPIKFTVEGVTVSVSPAIKYLGVWLDTKLTFAEHVKKITEKAEKTTVALSSLMPNIGGPRSSKRRMISSVIHSQILYAAPTWHKVTENRKLLNRLIRIQRRMCIRISSAYRTISAEAAGVISGVPPIDLLIKERNEKYNGESPHIARETLMSRWQQKWLNGTYGRWTCRLIPNIEPWFNREFGEVDYYLTQALSGHGCFRKYLFQRGKIEAENCIYCKAVDDAEHTLFACPRWQEIRQEYETQTGRIFNEENLTRGLLAPEIEWNITAGAIRQIIKTKEREDR